MRDTAKEKLSVTERTRPARILIVDDHPMVREGLTMRISAQPDLKVCGEAETEDGALALAKELNPDLMLIDISLKSGHGIELVKQIKSQLPAVKMLVVSGFQASLYAERAWRAGALGYLNKQESNDKVLEAIHTVLAGKLYFNSEITQRLLVQADRNVTSTANPISELTDRELEVFRMIGEGLSSGVIANRLFISSHTIDTHRENIKRKLGLKTAGELTRAAVQLLLENG
jgi:DNA-binding NarL/FixJ family response regulator